MIRIHHRDLQHLESALTREYLETNGLGGYASEDMSGKGKSRIDHYWVGDAPIAPIVRWVRTIAWLRKGLIWPESGIRQRMEI